MPEGVITSWNPAAESLLGSADMVGATVAPRVPEEFRSRHSAAFHAAMDSRALAHHGRPAGIQAMRTSGNVVPLTMALGLLKQDDGVVVCARSDAANAGRFGASA